MSSEWNSLTVATVTKPYIDDKVYFCLKNKHIRRCNGIISTEKSWLFEKYGGHRVYISGRTAPLRAACWPSLPTSRRKGKKRSENFKTKKGRQEELYRNIWTSTEQPEENGNSSTDNTSKGKWNNFLKIAIIVNC